MIFDVQIRGKSLSNCAMLYRSSLQPVAFPTKKPIESLGSPQPQTTSSNLDTERGKVIPAIDLVCRRITFKWEPIFNVVCRYAVCRCIIWRSTPSGFFLDTGEITVLFSLTCPRHNKLGVCFPDYGDLDYRDDPYFNRFGGYDLFRYLVSTHWPTVRESLGDDKFLSDEELKKIESSVDEEPSSNDDSTQGWEKIEDDHADNFIRALNHYVFELYDTMMKEGFKVPDHIAERVRKERLERGWGDCRPLPEAFKWEDLPAIKGVMEIIDRTWPGDPHWAIKD